MFREIILPIFRSTRLCVTACGIMHPRSWRWENNCPKHVELTGIINKPLLLHLVGCLYYLYFVIFFQTCQTISIYSSTECRVPFLVRKIYTFYIHDVLHLNVHFQGQRVKDSSTTSQACHTPPVPWIRSHLPSLLYCRHHVRNITRVFTRGTEKKKLYLVLGTLCPLNYMTRC